MTYRKGTLSIRPLQKGDEIYLLNWLTDPFVLRYYEGRDQTFTLETIKESFFTHTPNMTRYLVQYNYRAIGYLQYYELSEKKGIYLLEGRTCKKIYGIDLFIGETSYWNKGLGTRLVKLVTQYLFKVKQASCILIDPQVSNERAIRCYEKCGYQKIRVLPDWELHEGKYEDCLLMVYNEKSFKRNGVPK